MLPVLNVAFFAFHTALILFNVFGWIPRRTRRWNLATLLATLFSWTLMGIWYGQGYCVCTDWHLRVRAAMGIQDHADNYLVLLVRILTGWDPPVALGQGRSPPSSSSASLGASCRVERARLAGEPQSPALVAWLATSGQVTSRERGKPRATDVGDCCTQFRCILAPSQPFLRDRRLYNVEEKAML